MSARTPNLNLSKAAGAPRPGRLKIFFGMSPGVGKTYTMLQAAQSKLREGVDVVAGVVETHGRAETAVLLENIEQLPLAKISYRGTQLEEFDLDGMLRRAPDIALIDELAHSNIPGGRHPKRYQDVRELLDQGIHVYTTLNVQHLESRADAVETLSGAQVRERVPDTILEWADEIEIIDLSPERLRQRLSEGKVYLGDNAATAAEAFFSKKNLAALREMALRSTAERVNRDLVNVLKQERETKPLPTGERVMVAVGPSPFSARLIRWTKRYASALNANWVAVHIERTEAATDEETERLNQNLQLARSLGAEVVTTSGEDIAESLLRAARREMVTQIVTGRSPKTFLRGLLQRTLTDRLVSESGPIAVHVVPGETPPQKIRWRRIYEKDNAWKDYAIAAGAVVGLGLLTYPVREQIGYVSVSLLYMAATILGGLYLSRGSVLLMAIASALVWNFFFVPPQFTFNIHSGQDVLLFFLLLLIAVSMGQLTARLRALNKAERRRETRTFALYRFLDCLNQESDPEKTVAEALSHAHEVTGSRIELFLKDTTIAGASTFPDEAVLNAKEAGVTDWVVKNRDLAGKGTQNLPEIASLFIPVESGEQVIGVLRASLEEGTLPLASRDLLMQMGRLLGRFLEREIMRSKLEEMRVMEASQRLQKTLLDTVSHELKTPLTIILGSLEQVLSRTSENLGEQQLLFQAQQSSKRLLRNVNMLLDLTRFDAGVIKPQMERIDCDDLVHRLHHELTEEYGDRGKRIHIQTDGGTVQSDEVLLFQLLNQLLRNSMEHTPSGTEVHCEITCEGACCRIQVWDTGPGLPENVEALFEPFSHGSQRRSKGLGLGLSITKRICEILGGTLDASNTKQGGACFTATIPAQALG